MAQSRNEIRTVMVYRTECLEGNWIEMVVAGNFCVLFFLAFSRRFSCRACASRRYAQVRGGHRVSDCDVPGGAPTLAPRNQSETIGAFVV